MEERPIQYEDCSYLYVLSPRGQVQPEPVDYLTLPGSYHDLAARTCVFGTVSCSIDGSRFTCTVRRLNDEAAYVTIRYPARGRIRSLLPQLDLLLLGARRRHLRESVFQFAGAASLAPLRAGELYEWVRDHAGPIGIAESKVGPPPPVRVEQLAKCIAGYYLRLFPFPVEPAQTASFDSDAETAE